MGVPASTDDTDALTPALIECAEVHGLIEEGHELGCLSGADVADALRDIEVTTAQIEELLLLLSDLGIEITEEARVVQEVAPVRTKSSSRPSSTSPSRRRPTTRCACTCARSARCRCSPPTRRSRSPSASSAATWTPSAELIEANLRLVVSHRQAATSAAGCRSSTSSRRATSASSAPSRSSTTARATSSPPTPRGGSARPITRAHRRPGAHHPHPGAHGRDDQQARPRRSGSCSRTSAASRRRRRSPPRWASRPRRCARSCKISQEPVSLENADRRGGGLRSSATSSRTSSSASPVRGRRRAHAGARSSTRCSGSLTHRERKVHRAALRPRGRAARARSRRSASEFGVTRERIRQIEAKTLAKLKAYREAQCLHEHLD